MRGWLLAILLALGVILVLAVTGSGHDHTGRVVPAQTWANEVCVTIAAWAGEMQDIRQELQKNNYGARPDDGGDDVEETVTPRIAVDRAFVATKLALKPGLQRAGTPASPHGAAVAAALLRWAFRTEASLLTAQTLLMREAPSSSYASQAFNQLTFSVATLAHSVSDGLRTLHTVAAIDPTLRDAFTSSNDCRRLADKSA